MVEELFEKVKLFLLAITGWMRHDDGFIEVVTDYTQSLYFPKLRIDDAIEYAIYQSSQGHEVHFGPALRKADLGTRRSGRDNVLSSYCFFVDIDSPDKTLAFEEQKALLKSLLNKKLTILHDLLYFMPSFVIFSGHGVHAYFVLNEPRMFPDEVMDNVSKTLIELLDGDRQASDPARLLRLPGTRNYKDKDAPVDVFISYASGKVHSKDDVTEFIKNHAALVELNKMRGHSSSKPSKNPSAAPAAQIEYPPCIQSLLNQQNKPPLGYRHAVRFVLSAFAFHNGIDEQTCTAMIMHTTDDPSKAQGDVHSVYLALRQDKDKYTVGCGEGSRIQELIKAGVTICDEKKCHIKTKKKDKPEVFSAYFEGLVDIVEDSGNPAFLINENGILSVKTRIETEHEIILPPPKEAILWQLPKASSVMLHYQSDSDGQLFADLVLYFQGVSELPTENHFKLIALYALYTYIFQYFKYCPILWFYGLPERGKSRIGASIIHVCWRGVHMVTFNEPHVIRLSTDHKATIFLDIMDIEPVLKQQGTVDILLSRFEAGAKVPKVLYPEKGPFQDTVYYTIYGPTLLATNEPIDVILKTRTLQIVMPESGRSFNTDIIPENGISLRERCVAFRGRFMNKQISDADKPAKSRLGDMLRPLLQLIKTAGLDEKWFLSLCADFQNQRRDSESESLEGEVLSAIVDCKNLVKNNHFLVSDVATRLNRGRQEKFQITSQKIGKIIVQLGLEKYKDGSVRGYYWSERMICSLCARFGIEYKNDVGLSMEIPGQVTIV